MKIRRRVRRRSQGVHWVHVHPQGGEKNFVGQIYRGKLQVHLQTESAPPSPRGSARVQSLRNWGDVDGGRGYLGRFSVFWGRRIKEKGGQLFWRRKVHPRQNPGYAYGQKVDQPSKKRPLYNCLMVILLHTATVSKDWGQGSGLGANVPPAPS